MSDLPRFQIVHEAEFEEQLRALIFRPDLADEFIAYAEEMLARDPRIGVPALMDDSIWYLSMAPIDGNRVSLFYTFDEKTVTFLSILPFDD